MVYWVRRPLPAWAEKKINRIIFDFLWSGKNEQIKHEICHLPYELGGLKVVNVALKCKALHAKSVVFITDSQYKAKWVHLARYFISRALGKLHESWGFLSSNIKPHAWEAPSYYQSVASAAKDIKDVFITFVGKSLAVKVIYAELLSVSRVKVRSKTLWQEKLGRTIPWSKIYLRSYKGFSTNQEHDVFFRVLHYVLKTGEFNFKQTCSKKFEFWRRELKLNKFKKHCSIGDAFCRVDGLDRLVFTFS